MKETNKDQTIEARHNINDDMPSGMVVAFTCPMKCEGEKTYAEAGNCPKCGMGLKKMEMKNDGDHDH